MQYTGHLALSTFLHRHFGVFYGGPQVSRHIHKVMAQPHYSLHNHANSRHNHANSRHNRANSRHNHANSRHNRDNSRHNHANSRHNRESFNTAEVKCHGGTVLVSRCCSQRSLNFMIFIYKIQTKKFVLSVLSP